MRVDEGGGGRAAPDESKGTEELRSSEEEDEENIANEGLLLEEVGVLADTGQESGVTDSSVMDSGELLRCSLGWLDGYRVAGEN